MGRRSGRAAARRANAAIGSTPHGFESIPEDEPMQDAPPSSPEAEADPEDDEDEQNEGDVDEQGEQEDGDEEDEEEEEDGDGGEDGEQGDDDDDENKEKDPTPAPEQPVIRRKRLGRPPKNKPPDWDLGVIVQPGEEVRPRRGRGGGRGRGGRRGFVAPTKLVQVIDKDGTQVDIVNDECDLPEDPEGETKVDKLGNLQGGRDYRCRTFKVVGRGDRLYMLSTEPARCVGFRDSYLFFTKHQRLHKIIVGEEEKKDMIERDIIPHSYKGRSIGIVTARSVFREFGSRIIIGGKRIIDDYEVSRAHAEGAVEGELADPTDPFLTSGEPYNKNQYVAWHGASAVYHQPGQVPPEEKKPITTSHRKKKPAQPAVTDYNWMYEHALAASMYNANINSTRRAHEAEGVYDIYTNQMHYSANTQPSRARAERISIGDDSDSKSSIFPPLSQKIVNNFYVADIICKRPPVGIAPTVYSGYPVDSAGGDLTSHFKGLNAISDEIADLLPSECRTAFDKAKAAESDWKAKWKSEQQDMARREPVIDKAIVPYQMT